MLSHTGLIQVPIYEWKYRRQTSAGPLQQQCTSMKLSGFARLCSKLKFTEHWNFYTVKPLYIDQVVSLNMHWFQWVARTLKIMFKA